MLLIKDNPAIRKKDKFMESLLISATIFILAIFVGYEIITKVPPTLHTPLMSGSNAISGIVIVGAILVAGQVSNPLSGLLATIALIFATTNVIGGFMVTDRMLKMFKRTKDKEK